MTNNLNIITEEKYLEKLNDTVIDGKTDTDYRFTINRFLSSLRRPTRNYLDCVNLPTRSNKNFINDSNYLRIYDHIKDFRIKIPNYAHPSSIRCAFSSPYNEIGKVSQYLGEPWINQDYKVYIVNPRLYRYYKPDVITLAHVEDVDEKYMLRTTAFFINLINYHMIDRTGEPLFYLIG